MDLSVVIPLYNESESIDELNTSINNILNNSGLDYELIYVDDGSVDSSWEKIKDICKNQNKVSAYRFLKNYGKSMALSAGFKKSKGEIVITMDADLQDDPNEILALYKMINEDDKHIVSGWKKKRYDSIIFKNIPSKLFNWAARKASGIKLNDFNCGIKAYKSSVIKQIKLTDGMHRYIPVLAKTKYGADRFIKGFLDLLTLSFVQRFGKRPMHFFGLFGTIILLVGFIFSIYLGIDKLFINTSGRLITERPEFFISLAAMIIGLQFFLAGFLGEIILRTRKRKDNYIIKEEIKRS